MNPQSATMPSPPMAPATQPPNPAAAAEPSVAASGPSIVTNIPVHTQAQAAPAHEDAELDKIMHDVGQELKKEDKKPEKHGLLGFLHHDPKPLVKVNNHSATPVAAAPVAVPVQSAPSIPQTVPVATIPAPATPQAMAAAQPQIAAGQAKPKTQRHVPVFVIFVALCVTGFLVAAAIAAYKTSN